MNKWVKRGLQGVGGILGLACLGGGGFVYSQTSAFDASMNKVYDVPLPTVARSTDAAVLARGKHLAESIGACSAADCHGADFGGGKTLTMGPLGTITAPNLSLVLAAYSDGELARVIRHGIKKDGRSATLMPSHEFGWLSLEDVGAMVSFFRTVPKVDKANGPLQVGVLGKILDRQNKVPFDIARRIDHAARAKEVPLPPTASREYGAYIAKGCTGCHGDQLSGGPIPGAPPSMPVPKNITPHETGLKAWTYEDFDKLLTTGVSKSGKKLDPFMPYESLAKMNDVEKKALWFYLQSTEPVAYGNR